MEDEGVASGDVGQSMCMRISHSMQAKGGGRTVVGVIPVWWTHGSQSANMIWLAIYDN